MFFSGHKLSVLCDSDYANLKSIIALKRLGHPKDKALKTLLQKARVVPDNSLAATTISLGSTVSLTDLGTGVVMTLTIVDPYDVDADRMRVSVASAIGTTLMGLSVGDQIAWKLPNGHTRYLKITDCRQISRAVHRQA